MADIECIVSLAVNSKIVDPLLKLDEPINSAMLMSENINDIEARRNFRKGLAKLIGLVYTELMIPICKDCPDLLPDIDSAPNE